jgi:aspartate oxidase
VRSEASLHGVRASLAAAKAVACSTTSLDAAELANLATCAEALLTSATMRTESRGCHVREEYPDSDESWRRRIVLSELR